MHISKLGRGKRINAVEDVLSLGQEIEVRVDEIDDKGKVSLSPAGDVADSAGEPVPAAVGAAEAAPSSAGVVNVSFEESFDAELARRAGRPRSGERPGASDRNTGGNDRDRGGDRDRGRRRHR